MKAKKILKYGAIATAATLLVDAIVSTGMIAATIHEKANHTLEEDEKTNESIAENVEHKAEDDVALLRDSMDSLYIKLNLVHQAKESVDLVYYMFDNSDSATLLLNEIIKAADRGVKVRLLLNDLNNAFTLNQRWRSELLSNHPNISFYLYHNPKLNFYKINDNIHDKALIVDHDYLFTGGRNIQDRFYFRDIPEPVYDLDFYIRRREGDSSIDEFDDYYERLVNSKPVRRVTTAPRHSESELRELMAEAVKEAIASREELQTYPEVSEHISIHRAHVSFVHNQLNHTVKAPNLLKVLAKLGHRYPQFAWVTPYAVPYEPIRDILEWDEDKQDITILTNSKKTSPNLPAFSATLGYAPWLSKYSRLMSYVGDGSVHMKTVLYEDHITALGSFNLDPRSAFLNTETMAIIDSQPFQEELRDLLKEEPFVSWEEGKKADTPLHKNILLWAFRLIQGIILPLV